MTLVAFQKSNPKPIYCAQLNEIIRRNESATHGIQNEGENLFSNLTSFNHLKWMVQCHKDVYTNSRTELEFAYLPINEFLMNNFDSEMIEMPEFESVF